MELGGGNNSNSLDWVALFFFKEKWSPRVSILLLCRKGLRVETNILIPFPEGMCAYDTVQTPPWNKSMYTAVDKPYSP